MSNFLTPEFNNESAIAPWNASLEPNKAIIPQLDANRVLTGGVGQEVNLPTLTPESYDNIILPDASPTLMASALTTDSNSSLPDSSVDLLTGQAMSEVYGDLTKFAAGPDFAAKLNVAFGENWDAAAAKALAEEWFQGDFSDIPPVKVVSSAEIGGANGAFAAATDTIYLSREFLTRNGANPAAIADVLLEEIGHSVDARLNVTDSPGDEGAIFGAIVQGKELSEGELQGLKSEDDRATATIDGKILSLEYATFYGINFSQDWGGAAFDWSSGTKGSKAFYPFTRNDGIAASYKNGISRNWGQEGPSNLDVSFNYFGVSLWREADFTTDETYIFSLKADDYYKIRVKPVEASENEWINISGNNGGWLKDGYDGKQYTFNPPKTGKYWVNFDYAEAEGDASFSLVWDTNKTKPITVENLLFPVELSLYQNGEKNGEKNVEKRKAERSNIDPNKDTVVVIHGRGGGGDDNNVIDLAKTAAASNYYPNSQVLYLDWKEAANSSANPPYDAAKRIRPVADWAVNRLKELGIDPKKTILLGHSLGSYVASEIGRISGGVKELVALDPAFPGGTQEVSYDIDGNNSAKDRNIAFSKAAAKSTALVVLDRALSLAPLAGDNQQATTADNSYLVNFSGYQGNDAPKDYHNAVVDVFEDLISRPLFFPSLYTKNQFNDSGILRSVSRFTSNHEGIISADLSKGDARITDLGYMYNDRYQSTWT